MPSKKSRENKIKSIIVEGSNYTYNFSRGLLAHSLELRGLPLDKAYKVARKVHGVLVTEEIETISEENLREYVKSVALKIAGEEIAYQYNLIEHWHGSSIPLIILISGARGTQTSLIGELIAKKLAIPRIVSTSIVAQILRRMISPDLAPELHAKSYIAFNNLRPIYSVLYDKILIGYEEHSKYVAEAVEALVKRALNEGLSMVVRGEHLAPRFLSDDLIRHPNVLFVTLEVKDEEQHKNQYIKMYDEKQQIEKMEYFPAIRKIHDYLVEEAQNRNHLVISCENIPNTLVKINDLVMHQLAMIFPNVEEDLSKITYNFDDSIIHS